MKEKPKAKEYRKNLSNLTNEDFLDLGYNKCHEDYENFLPNEEEIRMIFSKHPCGANEYYETLVKQITKRIGK